MSIELQIANPAPGVNITTTSLADLVNLLRPLMSVVNTDSAATGTIFAQSTTPSPAQQGGIWLRLTGDTAQTPVNLYFYSTSYNLWIPMIRMPTGAMLYLQDLGLYGDVLSYNFNLTTGLGLFTDPSAPDHLPGVAAPWWGWRLHLANDSQTMMDRFVVSANNYTTLKGWQTMFLDGSSASRGGRSGAPLTPPVVPSVPVTGFEYDSAVVVGGGGVAGATVSNGGSGFTSAPGVTFTGGGGSGATGTATVSGGSVTGISITNPGSGFTSAPAVGFTGGGGSGAAATATLTSAKIPQAIVSQKYSGAAQSSDGIISGVINPSQTALTDYPPFVALGLLEFIGYGYTDPTVPF
jgi:hypothetical protein